MSDAEESTVQVGEVLGDRYEVTRIIGKGGMGTVVEARHRGLGESVALKILHPRYLDNAEAVARFEQEARAAVQIRGTHSARLIDVGTAPSGAPFLVMELLAGEDLAALLGRGAQPIQDAVTYILQACEGMAEVHAHGIVHRDLKPGNLFLTTAPDGSPLIKVLDFGIAKNVARDPAIGTLTMTLVALGTPLYMSPEQVRSSRTVDARADVWSLGAILYELLTGDAAFGGNTVAHITAQVLESAPEPMAQVRAEIPPGLEAAVMRALAKDADKRWVDVAAFAAALAPYAPDGAASAARTARILSLGISFAGHPGSSDKPAAPTLDPTDAGLPGTGRFVARRRRSRMLVGAALAITVGVLGVGIAAGSPWEAAAPGRVVAVTGVRNVALQRFGYTSMTARLGGLATKSAEPVRPAEPVGGETSPASSTAPASSSSPAVAAPVERSAAPVAKPPKAPGPVAKATPPATPQPKETAAPSTPPTPPQPKFDPLGARK